MNPCGKKTGQISVIGLFLHNDPHPLIQIIGAKRHRRKMPSLVFSAMNNPSIVFLDSGIGGLPYLAWVKERRPDLVVTYLADTMHFPYGELTENQVREAVVAVAESVFSKMNPCLLAVVCNTASVAALDDIRRIANCPVVGTVPAVKPAAQNESSAPIGLLATQGTVDSSYVDRLIEVFAPHRRIIRAAAGDIVRYVEECLLSKGDDGAKDVMEVALSKLKEAGIESLVIGCTHFLHVLRPIHEMMGDVLLIDSRDGVGRRILSLCKNCSPGTGNDSFLYYRRRRS